MKTSTPQSSTKTPRLILFGVLFVILVCLFWKSFLPQYIVFSNDGSYAVQKMQWTHLPESFVGSWYDQNAVGVNAGAVVPNFTQAFRWFFGALGYSKFIDLVALWFFGAAAFFFFRRAGLSAIAAVLGGIGACLTTSYFSNVCWGSVPPTIAFGLDLLAMGALIKRDKNLPVWVAPALAGLAVGMNVVEAADIGALLSLVVAAFAMFQALAEDGAALPARVVRAIWRTAVVSIFAGFIAAYAVSVLITANITGIAGTKQDEATKLQHYDFATQWSVPKKETLALFVPNLFGCNVIADPKEAYWGSIGTDPSWDRYFDSKGPLPSPQAYLRHTGRGIYIGAFIMLLAAWAGVQSLRKKDSGFTDLERRHVWFWWVVALVSLPLAWGRHGPVYQIIYHLPYFSTIRSPDKYLYIVTLAMVILCGYGIHCLSRRYLEMPLVAAPGGRFKSWWAKASMYERRCVVGLIGLVFLCVIGWGVYVAMRGHTEDYLVNWRRLDLLRSGRALEGKGLSDAQETAAAQVTFSIQQVGWFVVIIAASVGMLLAIMSGAFAGRRARWAGVFLGIILTGDLVRANLPYIHWWDYKTKYEVGNPEPVIKFLAEKPYEHRIAYTPPFPMGTPDQFAWFDNLYRIEWMQQLFPVYNIPTLDIVQMPRMPQDLQTFNDTMRLQFKTNPDGSPLVDANGRVAPDESTVFRFGRLWQLTATRYLVGPAPYLELMNAQFDATTNRFRIVQKFDLGPRPNVDRDRMTVSDLEAVPVPMENPNAPYALFEDTAALPRATLFSNWEIVTNDQAALAKLTERSFDPTQAIVLTKPLPTQPAGTNTDLTAVKITSYLPANIHLEATPTKPSVLMLADKYDPDWQVFVDGKRGEVLKCNYLMRGVYLEPGKHEVEFRFRPNIHMFYENLFAIVVAFCLLGYALVTIRKRGSGLEMN